MAIVNSGGIRGDRLYPAGSLTRRTLLEIHPFGNVVCKIQVPGRVVLEALAFGVSKLPAAAGHISSSVRIDVSGRPLGATG